MTWVYFLACINLAQSITGTNWVVNCSARSMCGSGPDSQAAITFYEHGFIASNSYSQIF